MKPLACIVAFMTTPKALKLRVTLPSLAIPYPRIRKASLGQEGVFEFVEYSDDGQSFSKYSHNETANELLRLIEPHRQLTVKELDQLLNITEKSEKLDSKLVGVFEIPDLNTEKILAFINTYGQMGLANLSRREKFERRMTKDGFEMSVDEFCARIAPKYNLSRTFANEYYNKNPKKLYEHCEAIVRGLRVPLRWIEQDIRATGRAIKAIAFLNERHKKDDERFIPLDGVKALRNFLGAIDQAPFEIPRGKSASEIHKFHPAWKIEPQQVERLVATFLSEINSLLQPLTRSPLQSDLKPLTQNFCVESYLLYSILTTESQFVERYCQKSDCGRPFYPERSTRTYCSTRCGDYVRQKEHREKKKKVSTSSSGKKKTERKAKNGKTQKASKTVRN